MRMLALLAGIIGSTPAMAEPTIKILSKASEGGYMLSASVQSSEAFAGRAMLRIDRSSNAGTISTTQSNTLALSPGESIVIARTDLSFAQGDTLDAVAILYDETDKEVFRTDLHLE